MLGGAPADGAEAERPDAALLAALAALPAEQRAVIVLRHLLGYTPREIGRMLAIPRGDRELPHATRARPARGAPGGGRMVSERELQAALRRVEPPDADAAAARAWASVEAALAAPAPQRTRAWGWRRVVPALAVALLAVAVALTPPGEALADWLRRAVEPAPRAPPRRPVPPVAFPGGGALLVRSGEALWIVDDRGRRTRLGRWTDAAWSPRGRFVAAVRGRELAALDRRGAVRWRLERPFPLSQPAWSSGDGQRIAYRSLDGLRVVAGDGTGDRLLAGPLGPAGPAGGRARRGSWPGPTARGGCT